MFDGADITRYLDLHQMIPLSADNDMQKTVNHEYDIHFGCLIFCFIVDTQCSKGRVHKIINILVYFYC